ncbi:MAG: glycosyltransferase family 4 protein [Limisphaerales bacterium]
MTHFPSPYQVELFDEIERQASGALSVCYLYEADPDRSWGKRDLGHRATFCEKDDPLAPEILDRFSAADLAIFNYYQHPVAEQLIPIRAASAKPWVFWGERLGVRFPGLAGRLVRRWKLRWLANSPAPIWGIGQFAVEGYQAAFGARRSYLNVPYYSRLDRFTDFPRPKRLAGSHRVVLFSGSLISRKGVDLVARAFVSVAREFPMMSLRLMGEGPLEPALREALEPVAANVEFMGFKDWPELPAHYAAADLLCAPSRYDGWGLVVPEGLAAGLPVIGTRRMGAALDLIQHGRNGWLLPAGDEEALRNALAHAASLPENDLRVMSDAARQSVTRHSIQHGAARFLAAARDAVVNWSA